MNSIYSVSLSLLMVLIVNSIQSSSVLASQSVDDNSNNLIILNYQYVADWEGFILFDVNATETGPKKIESCSLSLQIQRDVNGKLYWGSTSDYSVIFSARLESENKIVFSILVKDVRPFPNYRFTSVCRHSDGKLNAAFLYIDDNFRAQ
ncbi:uncharacterized protein LOC128389384 [Panonychus citri]|uniref:uncharacterized protein LOC128389384 n=1 Tax=Panonychus citri TaxID=50023 RepID=UPI002307E25F|nr:uncharacterized protein LOC128389384 [Panonychus citri]